MFRKPMKLQKQEGKEKKKTNEKIYFLVPFSHNVWLMCERNKLKRLTEVKSTLLKSYNSTENTD